MPVSSLLLTFEADHLDAIRATVSGDARFLVGDPVGARLPVALETPDRAADRAAWDWLRTIEGVTWIDLVWISIDTDDAIAWTPGRSGASQHLDGAES